MSSRFSLDKLKSMNYTSSISDFINNNKYFIISILLISVVLILVLMTLYKSLGNQNIVKIGGKNTCDQVKDVFSLNRPMFVETVSAAGLDEQKKKVVMDAFNKMGDSMIDCSKYQQSSLVQLNAPSELPFPKMPEFSLFQKKAAKEAEKDVSKKVVEGYSMTGNSHESYCGLDDYEN